MKKKIISLIMGLCALTTLPVSAKEVSFPNLRTAQGTYYDYLVVETTDGNEWLLDDSTESKYISNGNAIFTDKENVIVLFDTMGTEDVTDDVILDVHSLY